MNPPKLLLLSLMLCTATFVHAQSIGPSAIDAAGGSVSAGGNTYEYAIGQVVAGNTFTAASLVVTPGVLQPVSTTGVTLPAIAQADLKVFPSPAETTLYLQPAFSGSGSLQYSLYDAAGKLVLSHTVILKSGTERQVLNVAQIAAGQYMLRAMWLQAGITYTSGYKVQKLR